MTFMFIVMLTLAFIFIWLNHPISMGITIIAQTLTVAMIAGLSLGSFWYSYIIMITMLSGMLVLFIYMASVASNEKFFTSIKLLVLSIIFLALGGIMQFNSEYSDNEFVSIITSSPTEIFSLNNLFNCKLKMLTMMLVTYLFFTMITVSFIVNISEGPLRISKK
uniref:NADH dehydrogenase subunit 6 n=1 Tax=Leptoglossus membranaceus TaxID=2575657 RepID=A0A4D6X1V6_9HEMI|nr:NADH dehydrogenase subunit 6 [Leptoglossus membranaceus]QCI09362.1 NADH dehydrogenase subunit 6 [Leptoglossus membranaceus]